MNPKEMTPEEWSEFIEFLESLFREETHNKEVVDAFMNVWTTMNKALGKKYPDRHPETNAKMLRFCIDRFAMEWAQ